MTELSIRCTEIIPEINLKWILVPFLVDLTLEFLLFFNCDTEHTKASHVQKRSLLVNSVFFANLRFCFSV